MESIDYLFFLTKITSFWFIKKVGVDPGKIRYPWGGSTTRSDLKTLVMALLVKPVIQVINSNGLNNVFSLKFILNTHTHTYKEGKKKTKNNYHSKEAL